MGRRMKIGIAAAVVIGLGLIGLRAWQEASYGTGPVASHTTIDGPAHEAAFVANSVGGTVSVIDIGTGQVIGTMDVLPDGASAGFFRDPLQALAQGYVEGQAGLNYVQDTDLSRDGRVLFVSRGYLGDVAAFDIASGDILWRTPVSGLRSDHMDVSPDGRRLYVSTLIYSGNRVEVIDTATGDIIGGYTAGQWPHDVHVSPDGARVYTASLGDMQAAPEERGADADAYLVTVHDTETLEQLAAHAFDAGIRPFTVTADEGRLYAQLSLTHAIVARDLESGAEVGRIDLPVAEGVNEDDWDFDAPHHGLALSADETLLCAAGRASDYAAIVDAPDLTLRGTVPVGDAPSWAVLAGDDRLCLTANTRSDTVSLIDVAALEEVARLEAGRGPKHISVGMVPEAVLEALRAE